jgi:hypothetical protein
MIEFIKIAIFVIWIVSMIVLALVLLYKADGTIQRQKECIEQVVDMLRSYKNEPDEPQAEEHNVQECVDMAECIFTEMVQYLSEKEKEKLKQIYESER